MWAMAMNSVWAILSLKCLTEHPNRDSSKVEGLMGLALEGYLGLSCSRWCHRTMMLSRESIVTQREKELRTGLQVEALLFMCLL